jgi:hypothetical protein
MRIKLAVVVALTLGAAHSATAQPAVKTGDEVNRAILGYDLTLPKANQLLTALPAMTKHVVSLPDYKERMAKASTMSPEEIRAKMESDPKAMEILKVNGLTASDYLVGIPALRMALLKAKGMSGDNITVSPANLTFAKANLDVLWPKLSAAEGLGPRP